MNLEEPAMTATVPKTTETMLWPDGHLDIPEQIRRELGLEGGWACTIEVVDGTLVVRPEEAIPDEDLWAYEPETHARLLEAAQQPMESGIKASPRDLRDLMEGRLSVEELIARAKT
jgi:antitoxin component of MazEF toxin-antitoxin module